MIMQTLIKKIAESLHSLDLVRKLILLCLFGLIVLESAFLSGAAFAHDRAIKSGETHEPITAGQFLFSDSPWLIGVEGEYVIPEGVEKTDKSETEKPIEPETEKIPEPEPETTALLAGERMDAVREDASRGLLLLVNKTHPVDESYRPEDLTAIKYYAADRSESCRYMREEAAGYFHQMIEAAQKEDLAIVMTTAFRSYSFQQMLWESYVANQGEAAAATFSAKPGQSEHQTGLAVDVSAASVDYQLTDRFGATKEGKWLAENAHLFGFILRYPRDG
ncbi:MAG: M15 family metallopeptidase, partial [Eubacteriales bacterium]|nr:M15 family metallopeptidase [Eubacteriales bacterium]